MAKYILDRLKERSTWIGITSLLTTAGVILSPEQTESIIAFGVTFAGLIATFTKDKK